MARTRDRSHRQGSLRPAASGPDRDALPMAMPAWPARALAWMLVLALAAGLAAGFLVPFARTVSGPFVLLPAEPPVPVLAPADGVLEAALADEGAEVSAGDLLFRLRAGASLLEVRSPAAGMLLALDAGKVGDPVAAGRMLAQVLAPGSPLLAVIDLPEDALPLVEAGQTARLLFTAYPQAQFGAVQAVIRRVNQVPVLSGGGPVLKAFAEPGVSAIEVRGRERPLLAGLRGEARIVVDRRPLLGVRASRPARD